MKPATPPTPDAPIDLRLSSNEGRPPRGLPPLGELCGPAELARYPDDRPLREALALRLGVEPERVLVTAGGDDLLLRFALAHLGPERHAVAAAPTFEMIPRHVALARAELVEVPWTAGPYPVEAALEALRPGAGALFLVTPNNPTGLAATERDLVRLAERAAAVGARVLLDHAYVEMADEDLTPAALELDDVVVLRTFSKAWGLAGARVGYGLGAPEEIERLAAAGNPFAVPGPSLALALARLGTGEADVRDAVHRVRHEREELRARLVELGFEVEPSQANFVLARGARAEELARGLASLGIGVRLFDDRDDLRDAVRIGCPAEETAFERLTRALERALEDRR